MPLELSCPLSQIFTFCAQNKSFIPQISALIELTINSDYRSDNEDDRIPELTGILKRFTPLASIWWYDHTG
eukprot:COSAG05_NODE_21821_length_269_cov_0.605882_1_plen_70_part_10